MSIGFWLVLFFCFNRFIFNASGKIAKIFSIVSTALSSFKFASKWNKLFPFLSFCFAKSDRFFRIDSINFHWFNFTAINNGVSPFSFSFSSNLFDNGISISANANSICPCWIASCNGDDFPSYVDNKIPVRRNNWEGLFVRTKIANASFNWWMYLSNSISFSKTSYIYSKRISFFKSNIPFIAINDEGWERDLLVF